MTGDNRETWRLLARNAIRMSRPGMSWRLANVGNAIFPVDGPSHEDAGKYP
jgi:hypothetical protein